MSVCRRAVRGARAVDSHPSVRETVTSPHHEGQAGVERTGGKSGKFQVVCVELKAGRRVLFVDLGDWENSTGAKTF